MTIVVMAFISQISYTLPWGTISRILSSQNPSFVSQSGDTAIFTEMSRFDRNSGELFNQYK